MEVELISQPEVWARAAEQAAAEHLLPAAGERVAVVGCGTSWFMAQSYAAAREAARQGVTDALNYWAAETGNLAECAQPLFDFVQAAQITGNRTASRLYGARGWGVHHNSDIWAYSLPVGHGELRPTWSFWPMGGLWLANHLWDHVRFGASEEFGRKQAWPALSFALDWAVENSDASLGTSPSTSPENAFEHQGRPIDLGASSTLDLSLIREVLTHLVALARLLRIEDDSVVREAVTALP